MLVLLTNIATNEDLDPHLMAFRPALMHTCRPSLIPANLSTLAKFDSPMCVACVQMSPILRNNWEKRQSPIPIFPEGWGTSVHRLQCVVLVI